jgi:hypothetical protein
MGSETGPNVPSPDPEDDLPEPLADLKAVVAEEMGPDLIDLTPLIVSSAAALPHRGA